MKNKLGLLAIVLLFAGNSMFAQTTASATAAAYAKIIAPIAITLQADLHFGDIVAGTAAGTVTMPATSDVRTALGGASLPTTSQTAINRALFYVTGEPTYTYVITLPADGVVSVGNGTGGTMAINGFTSSPTPTAVLVAGNNSLYVGATLTVGASQASGAYSTALLGGTGAFTVTVNYQ